MTKYKITWLMISPIYVESWKKALKNIGDRRIANGLYAWYETSSESEDFNIINKQLVNLMTMQAEGKEPIKDVKFFKTSIIWEEVKQEDFVKV